MARATGATAARPGPLAVLALVVVATLAPAAAGGVQPTVEVTVRPEVVHAGEWFEIETAVFYPPRATAPLDLNYTVDVVGPGTATVTLSEFGVRRHTPTGRPTPTVAVEATGTPGGTVGRNRLLPGEEDTVVWKARVDAPGSYAVEVTVDYRVGTATKRVGVSETTTVLPTAEPLVDRVVREVRAFWHRLSPPLRALGLLLGLGSSLFGMWRAVKRRWRR